MSVIREVRKWQKKAFAKLAGKRFGLLKAVTGSGKSVAIAMLAHNYYINNRKNNPKIIVSVPNKGIGNNFADIHIVENDTNFKPQSKYVLTSADSEAKKTETLLQFLNENSKTFQDSIAVCCHQTLLRAVEKYPEKFKNCFVVPDEVHHSRADGENGNKLGKAITTICAEISNNVLMVTATPFRSDGGELFPDSIRDQVVRFSYTLSEYLADCDYLKEIKYEGHFYDHVSSYYESLKEYFQKNGVGKTIVFLPHVRLEDRRLELNTVLASTLELPQRTLGTTQMLAELLDPQEGPYRRVNSGDLYWEYQNQVTGRKLIVVDLDDDNEIRNHRLEWLSKNKIVQPDTDYLLISLQVFIEGGDFPAINKVINLSIDKSFLRMIQKWGRATRDYEGKSVASFIQFMNINEGYNLSAADSYNESQLEEMIELQEADLDVIELQQISVMRGQLLENISRHKPENLDFDQDMGEIVQTVPANSTYSVINFVQDNWKYLVAACLLGMAVGGLVQYGTNEYAKKDTIESEVKSN